MRNGAEGNAISFNPLYVVNVDDSGDLNMTISNLPGSGITLDMTVTIHPDGTHTVTRRSAEGDWEATYLFSDGGGLPLRVTVRRAGEVLELAVSDAGE